MSPSSTNARDITDHVFLQVSSSDLFSDFGIPGNFRAEQVPRAPPYWDGIGFTPQAQRDDVLASAPVGMSENMSCVHFTTPVLLTGEILRRPDADFRRHSSWLNHVDTNLNTAAPTATTTTGGAGRVGTVLGKRARKWYGTSRVASQLMTMTAAALDHPKREEGQGQAGSWRRQRGPQRGLTIRLPPGPSSGKLNASMTVQRGAERLAP